MCLDLDFEDCGQNCIREIRRQRAFPCYRPGVLSLSASVANWSLVVLSVIIGVIQREIQNMEGEMMSELQPLACGV